MSQAVSCIDLFCGAGGLTYGFEIEGISVVAGVDLDPRCKYPYETNNQARFVERSVERLRTQDVNRYFDSAKIRILAGCAPCQPFSTYTQGQDTEKDHKWGLLYEFSRLTKATKPEIVTMENVPTVGKHAVFSDFVATLVGLGYQVWHDVVQCAEYGVPQTRRRMVLLASLLGPLDMIPPSRKKPRTVKQAIGRLAPIDAGGHSPRDRLHTSSSLSNLNMRRMKASRPGGTWRDWPKALVAKCHRSQTGRTYPGVYGRMEWGKPAPTMTTQCFGFGNGRFGHPEQDRAISLREAAILQGFPRGYKFVPPSEHVEFSPVGRLIGNAVPVGLGRAIARSILAHIEEVSPKRRTTRRRKTVNA